MVSIKSRTGDTATQIMCKDSLSAIWDAVCLKESDAHLGQFLQDGKNEQNVAFFLKKLKLYCDQTV